MKGNSMKICKVEGCDQKHYAKEYCRRHYNQFWRVGKTIGHPTRTLLDPNEFIIEGDVCRIKLYDKNGNERAETIIDADDYEKVKDRKWGLTGEGYVTTNFGRTTLLLGHLILGHSPNQKILIDHRNLKKLDNRKNNLRLCTYSQNFMNAPIRKSNTSGFKGVGWRKEMKKWRAYIGINKRFIHLGYFTDILAAARAYNEASIKYFGEFARLNAGV